MHGFAWGLLCVSEIRIVYRKEPFKNCELWSYSYLGYQMNIHISTYAHNLINIAMTFLNPLKQDIDTV